MTTTKQRTDCHRPSVIDPTEYEYVGIEYMKTDISVGDELFLADERRRIEEHRERTGATYSQHQHGGNCHVCGAHAIYTALFHHLPTNTYIRTGFDCASKLDGGDEYAFKQFKVQMKDARARKRGKAKAKLLLEDAGLSEAWPYHGDLAELREANPNAVATRGGDRKSRFIQYWPAGVVLLRGGGGFHSNRKFHCVVKQPA